MKNRRHSEVEGLHHSLWHLANGVLKQDQLTCFCIKWMVIEWLWLEGGLVLVYTSVGPLQRGLWYGDACVYDYSLWSELNPLHFCVKCFKKGKKRKLYWTDYSEDLIWPEHDATLPAQSAPVSSVYGRVFWVRAFFIRGAELFGRSGCPSLTWGSL